MRFESGRVVVGYCEINITVKFLDRLPLLVIRIFCRVDGCMLWKKTEQKLSSYYKESIALEIK